MEKKLLFILFLCCSAITYGQLACPRLTSPVNGDTNVPVDATITWNGIIGAPGYLISIGTTPGGTDIVNERGVGNATSYQPPLGLPENTNIYVTITIFFFNAENTVCSTEMFRTEDVTQPPNCTSPRFPIDGSMNVSVTTSIVWNHAPTATGYRISLGTTPGATDILNNENVVGAVSYQPTIDLPVDTEIFVTIVPYNDNGPSPSLCPHYSFTTGAMVLIPTCTSMVNPVNGGINVELSPVLEWTEVPDATGYRVTIGTTPFNANVLDNVTFTENSTLVVEFEPNLTFFIRIIPFNSAGEAIGCEQQSFSTILGCGPYFDSIRNELIDLRPEIDFPDLVSFCENVAPFTVSSEDSADGFRWYKVDQFDNEQLISSEREVVLNETGRYRYEAYNIVTQSGNTLECDISKIFEVVSSEIATIGDLSVTGQNGTIDVSVPVSGLGDYEFAVDNIDGPYQDSSNFQNLAPGFHTFYVRDKNGCGIAEKTLEQDLTLEGFPKFFTPNGDGVNDFWQFIQPPDTGAVQISSITIFNRYGMFLKQIEPTSLGWDGNLNGEPLPASDYWFQAISNNRKILGHFTLKR